MCKYLHTIPPIFIYKLTISLNYILYSVNINYVLLVYKKRVTISYSLKTYFNPFSTSAIIVYIELSPPSFVYQTAGVKYIILSFLYASVDLTKSLSNKALAVHSPPVALPLSNTNKYSGFCSAMYSNVTFDHELNLL